jgi:hypothetical protein
MCLLFLSRNIEERNGPGQLEATAEELSSHQASAAALAADSDAILTEARSQEAALQQAAQLAEVKAAADIEAARAQVSMLQGENQRLSTLLEKLHDDDEGQGTAVSAQLVELEKQASAHKQQLAVRDDQR